LRPFDFNWEDFLIDQPNFTSFASDPMTPCHILFSSGTTATPKAIPWNHTTPIKAAADAYFHHDLKPQDVLTWPTNLGWMMGPWLIFAAFINRATIALYPDTPNQRSFGEFVEKAKVTILGVVPTLVASWQHTQCMENLDWTQIKLFTSTGECSNPNDMRYLMSLAGNKPVIEYCGGTEIGGAYVTSTLVEANYPSLFSTPAMGIDFVILDEEGGLATQGEVALIPPSIGLSTELLNGNHAEVYYANMPMMADKVLRRHGDQIKQFDNGYYCMLGRADDAMNLGGIKTSSAEIERALANFEQIDEVAAIAIPPLQNGPSQLIIYAATKENLDKTTLLKSMQKRLSSELNPLFKIYDVILISALPKTASNKIMRRILRDKYIKEHSI
jgi:acetyl-CoA synthetase